jgi:hypothetical protein
MSIEEIGRELGANTPGHSNEYKRYHSTVGAWIRRGRTLVEEAWGPEGWQERAEVMRTARLNYRSLSEKEQAILEMAEGLALHAGVSVEKAYDLIHQDIPDDNLDAFSRFLWAVDRSLLKTWLRACANRQVAYVTRSCVKAIKSLRELPSAKSCQPIGAAS